MTQTAAANKILISAPVHDYLLERLKTICREVIYQPAITHEELVEIIDDVEGLIVTTRIKIDKKVIDEAGQ